MVPVFARRSLPFWLLVLGLASGCGPNGGASTGVDTPAADLPGSEVGANEPAPAGAPACAPTLPSDGLPPGVEPQHRTLGFWLEQQARQLEIDRPLLRAAELRTLDRALEVPRADYHGRIDLLAPIDAAQLEREVAERRSWARDKLGSGELVSAKGAPLGSDVLEPLGEEVALDGSRAELRVALRDAQIHCAPLRASFYTKALDPRLDRNACSVLRAQDVVRVIARWPNGMQLVQASFAFGWLAPDVALSQVVPERLAAAFVRGPTLQVHGGELVLGAGADELRLPEGTLLAAADNQGQRAFVATPSGFVQSAPRDARLLRSTTRDLTRRSFLEEAWRYVGMPYGLGDTAGGRDCSRLVLDAFEAFDLHMPRHSAWQAQAGSFWIDVDGVSESESLLLFDAALQKGIVLLDFPGHIMIYLGRNERGEPMVLHALGEYMASCGTETGTRGEALVRVKDIGVTTLELGRGTSRKALIERVTRITVVGGTPGPELAGVAQLRPAAEPSIPSDRQCSDSEHAALYVLPEQPNQDQPLRVVAALSEDPGPAQLLLIDPSGRRVTPDVVRLGGPPHGRLVSVDEPQRGRWKAVLADGDDVIACQRISVAGRRPKPNEPDEGPIWLPRYKWNVNNENLYSLFVERLFDYPLADELTWTSLHPLLRDPQRNLLFDYRGLDEDNRIKLAPDCADLPYALRSYFAWKMRLPFGYRRCTRGRLGKPPSCDQPGSGDNLMSRLELPGKGGPLQPRDDVKAFELFINTQMRSAVHSSSGRTLPNDELSDLYPVALTRESLRPGTVFADPYGHLLVLADWIPQGATGSGVLVGVDAQPDGTVAQRRFWRGSFLFDPDTTSGGAGFKAFRPRLFKQEAVQVPFELKDQPEPVQIERVGFLEDVENEDLRRSRRYVPLSVQQYEGSADDFYDAVERLINPRPLEPKTTLRALLDAFEESVSRRVGSVDNGEKWAREHPGEIVDMPEGDSIFLSAGPWEDFSTPSRDLRLLISIDTVIGFPARVRLAPQRFGLSASELAGKGAELDALLAAELARRQISYTRSDGSAQTLTLQAVVQRAPLFELAYNPNDCVEVRWAAAPGSAEMATCRRHAPAEQRAKMEQYRSWFSTRKRPPQ
jgi:cell wall-associated NlpC family hydrolase